MTLGKVAPFAEDGSVTKLSCLNWKEDQWVTALKDQGGDNFQCSYNKNVPEPQPCRVSKAGVNGKWLVDISEDMVANY